MLASVALAAQLLGWIAPAAAARSQNYVDCMHREQEAWNADVDSGSAKNDEHTITIHERSFANCAKLAVQALSKSPRDPDSPAWAFYFGATVGSLYAATGHAMMLNHAGRYHDAAAEFAQARDYDGEAILIATQDAARQPTAMVQISSYVEYLHQVSSRLNLWIAANNSHRWIDGDTIPVLSMNGSSPIGDVPAVIRDQFS